MAKLVVLFVTAFVDMVGLTIVLPLLPYYATQFGANATTVGILVSAFSVAQLVGAPYWGRLSDRYGRRPAILTGLLVTALAYVIFAFADSVLLLLISRVVQGVGGGTIGVVQAYVADTSPPRGTHQEPGLALGSDEPRRCRGPRTGIHDHRPRRSKSSGAHRRRAGWRRRRVRVALPARGPARAPHR